MQPVSYLEVLEIQKYRMIKKKVIDSIDMNYCEQPVKCNKLEFF